MKKTDVSHYDGLTWWGPMSDARMETLLGLVDLPAGATAVDIGCGRGELLVRLAERSRIRAVGVDRSSAALEMVRAAFDARVPGADLVLEETDASTWTAEPGSLAFVGALGAPFIGDGYASSLRAFAQWLEPGGLLLAGLGFWAQDPPAEFLEATGIDAAEFTDHSGNLVLGEETGFDFLYCGVSNRDEWDHFEMRLHHNHERYAAAHPEDTDAQEALVGKRRWMHAQQKWGRDTMGFGMYLWRRGA